MVECGLCLLVYVLCECCIKELWTILTFYWDVFDITVESSSSGGSDSAVSSSDSEEDVVSRSNSNDSSSDSDDSDNNNPFSTKSESKQSIYHIAQLCGGGKYWRIDGYSPMFYLPIFSLVIIYSIGTYFDSLVHCILFLLLMSIFI